MRVLLGSDCLCCQIQSPHMLTRLHALHLLQAGQRPGIMTVLHSQTCQLIPSCMKRIWASGLLKSRASFWRAADFPAACSLGRQTGKQLKGLPIPTKDVCTHVKQLLPFFRPGTAEDVTENKPHSCTTSVGRYIAFICGSGYMQAQSTSMSMHGNSCLTMKEVGLARTICTNCSTKRLSCMRCGHCGESFHVQHVPTVLTLLLKGSAMVWSL